MTHKAVRGMCTSLCATKVPLRRGVPVIHPQHVENFPVATLEIATHYSPFIF